MNNNFAPEKIVALACISKDFVANSPESIPPILSNLFWEGFKGAISTKKALPLDNPEPRFVYLPYRFNDSYDNENYSTRMTIKALRLKTRGRRSAQFCREQEIALSKCEKYYPILFRQLIRDSGILSPSA
jgi:hypothetical protein